MAVQEQTPYIEYVANGTTKVFPLTFDCDDQDHLIITIDGDEPSMGSWLLIDGSVSFKTAPPNNSKIIFQRNSPVKRTANYSTYNNSFRPEPVNKDFDRIWWKLQEMGLANWLLGLRIDKEIRDRIAADIYHYTLITKETDYKINELKDYLEALINNMSGGELLPILDKYIKTWSGRAQDDKNKDFADARDYGAKAYNTLDYNTAVLNDTENSTTAFIAMESKIKGQPVNLGGKYYKVDRIFKANNYYNGFFVVSGLIQKQELITARNLKWIVGCGEGFIYDEIQSRDAHRSAGIIQSIAYDQFQQAYYCLSNYVDEATKEDFGIIQKFHIESKVTTFASDVSLKSKLLGHQGLGLQYIDGKPWLWVGTNAKDSKSGTHIIRCTPPKNNSDITDVQYFKVYDESERLNTTYHCTPTVSPYQDLVCVSNINYEQHQNLIKIFDINTFIDSSVDYSQQYISKFYLVNEHNGTTLPVQSVVTDGEFVYVLLGTATIQVYTLLGKLISIMAVNVGYNKSQSLVDANGTAISIKYYEPESLLFVPTNSGYTLAVSVAMGYGGSWSAETDVRRNYIYTSMPRFQFIGRDFGSVDRPQIILDAKKAISFPYTKGFNLYTQGSVYGINEYKRTLSHTPYNLALEKLDSIVELGRASGLIVSVSDAVGRYVTTISSVTGGANQGAAIVMYGNADAATGVAGTSFIYAGNKGIQHGVGVTSDGLFRPVSSGSMSNGSAQNMWKDIFSVNGVIQTSDERLKQQFRPQSEREKSAALEIKNSICLFKFNDALDLKGDGARWHIGVKAQEVVFILEKHKLKPFDYAFVCFDEWGAQSEIVEKWGDEFDKDGNLTRQSGSETVQEARKAGSRYAIRYDELSMFILAAL